MSETEGILCSKSHEYILEKGDCHYLIGLTEYALEQLGDIVFLELPEIGAKFNKGDIFATIESVKAASEIYMPISGTVVQINETAMDNPEILNESPYEKGWLIEITSNADHIELADLLDYEDYKEALK